MFEASEEDIRENIKDLAFGGRDSEVENTDAEIDKAYRKNSRFPRIRNVLRYTLSIRRKRIKFCRRILMQEWSSYNSI